MTHRGLDEASMGKASRTKVESTRREKIAAQRAAERKAEKRRRILLASGSVVVGCRRRGDTVHIEVWDSGPGIPEDQRRNIFGEFYRLAGGNTHGGLGLGLAIVDRLCNLL